MAELNRPFPPGDYPVSSSAAGPARCRCPIRCAATASTTRSSPRTRRPAACSGAGRHFQRLLSWTKPHAPVPREDRAYERYDWNSLLADEPRRARPCSRTSWTARRYFPSRPEMEANLVAFADRARIDVRYDCTWTGTRSDGGPDGAPSSSRRPMGRTAAARSSWRSGSPSRSRHPAPGWSSATTTPTSARPSRTPAAGCSSSASRTPGSNSPTACCRGPASSSSCRPRTPSCRSIPGRWSASAPATSSRSRTTSWVAAWPSSTRPSIGSSGASDGALHVALRRTDGGGDLALEVDDVISATGFVTPLRGPAGARRRHLRASQLPVQTPWWESATVPGIRFAGNDRPGRQGPSAARRSGQFRRRPRGPLQRPGPRR